MTEPTCDNCVLYPTCRTRWMFDRFLFDIRIDYTDREQLPIEKDWHEMIGRDCRNWMEPNEKDL